MNTKTSENKTFDSASVGKQQLLIKSRLKNNTQIAKEQLAVKTALAGQRDSRSRK